MDSKIVETTVTLDEKLLERAKFLTGMTEQDQVLEEALKALIQREAARRLIELGGSAPDLASPPRRREQTG